MYAILPLEKADGILFGETAFTSGLGGLWGVLDSISWQSKK